MCHSRYAAIIETGKGRRETAALLLLQTVAAAVTQEMVFFSPPGEGGSKNPCPTLSSRDASLEDQTPRSGDWRLGVGRRAAAADFCSRSEGNGKGCSCKILQLQDPTESRAEFCDQG